MNYYTTTRKRRLIVSRGFAWVSILVLIVVCLLRFVFIYWLYEEEDTRVAQRSLTADGYVVIPNATKEKVLTFLPKGYVFLDYRYRIKGCTLSTFHRDVTSSQYVFSTSRPTYTFIVYRNAGRLLSVCPSSEKTTPFCFSAPTTIVGEPGTGILFDCDLLHAGAFDGTADQHRYAEQFKIVHISDVGKLGHLAGVDVIKHGNCAVSYSYEWMSRKVSLLFPFLFNHIFTPYLQDRPTGYFGNVVVAIYGRDFYNK